MSLLIIKSKNDRFNIIKINCLKLDDKNYTIVDQSRVITGNYVNNETKKIEKLPVILIIGAGL
jgi:hypothetical protein